MQYVAWGIIAYLILINIVTFIVFGVDKTKAKNHSWRVPEKTLFLLAIIGGSVGAIIGMHTFRHKTRKWYFAIGMPLILIVQVVIAWAFGAFPVKPADVFPSATEVPAQTTDAEVDVLNDDQPLFTDKEKEEIQGESYSELDYLGRCGEAVARLHKSMMPTGERGSIGHVKPSGWHTVKYPDLIKDRYLFNRSHLIAYALTGQTDNEKNLITGTRHMNAELMLPYERRVIDYLEDTGNHVLYRVRPRFEKDELVARGVEMEAWSVEDEGKGLSFHVFLHNVQPGIVIDYKTGESKRA